MYTHSLSPCHTYTSNLPTAFAPISIVLLLSVCFLCVLLRWRKIHFAAQTTNVHTYVYIQCMHTWTHMCQTTNVQGLGVFRFCTRTNTIFLIVCPARPTKRSQHISAPHTIVLISAPKNICARRGLSIYKLPYGIYVVCTLHIFTRRPFHIYWKYMEGRCACVERTCCVAVN